MSASQPTPGGVQGVVFASPDQPLPPQLQQAQPAVFLLPTGTAPRRAPAGPGAGPPQLSLQALQLDADAVDVLGSLAGAGAAAGDPWALAAVTAPQVHAGSLPPALVLPLAQAQHAQAAAAAVSAQLSLQQAAALGLAGGGAPLQMPTGPRAPRVRRHSMFVAGQPAHPPRRGSIGNVDTNGGLLSQLQAAYAAERAAAASVASVGEYSFGPGPLPGLQQPGLASAAIAERLAAAGVAPATLSLQSLPLPLGGGTQVAQPSAGAQQQQQVWISAAGTGGPVLVPNAPRAPGVGASRRHSWCPATVYYSTEGPRAALQARLAYRAVAPTDALAALALGGGGGGDGSVASGYSFAGGGGASLHTPSSSLMPSQPASPLGSSTSSIAAQRVANGGGLPPGVALQLLPGGADGMPYLLLQGSPGSAAKLLTGSAMGLVDTTGGSDAAAVLLDPGLLAGQAAAMYAAFDPTSGAALSAAGLASAAGPAPAPRGGKSGGRVPARGGEPPQGPTGATPPEQLRLLPVPAPVSQVCGDARWELKRNGSGDAGDTPEAVAGSSVENLTTWLESRRTLVGERLREERRRARAAARAAIGAGAPGAGKPQSGAAGVTPATFAYALPDAGDDTWGGSGGAAAAAATAAAAAADAEGSSEPSNKLFVGNIGWWVTEEDLLAWFSRFGTVTGVKVRAELLAARMGHPPGELGFRLPARACPSSPLARAGWPLLLWAINGRAPGSSVSAGRFSCGP
jgi:hypothetical protein